ncbi:MAG TPA: hypothetical protein VIJ04_15505, partial [Xanthobacteraceae bacterium]
SGRPDDKLRDEAIQRACRLSQRALDCFAEPAIGPRDFARVRWLAMTSNLVLAARLLRPSYAARHEQEPPNK